jgi:hypothetical protein
MLQAEVYGGHMGGGEEGGVDFQRDFTIAESREKKNQTIKATKIQYKQPQGWVAAARV